MAAVLGAIHPEEIIETTAGVRALISSVSERHQTGLVRLAYPNEENLYIFFKRGSALASTLVAPQRERIFVRGKWEDQVNSAGDAYPASIPLSPFGLFLFGLSLQAGQNQPSETLTTSSQISEYFKLRTSNSTPCLVQLNWEHAAGLVFFPEHNTTSYSIFISHQTLRDEAGISPIFYQWKDAQCAVSMITPDLSVDLWQEYRLRRLFADICNALLTRFETLAGRALMESLIRVMTAFASERDLDLYIHSRCMEDGEVFLSPAIAAENYSFFLSEMIEHCSIVIGPRLLASQLREIVSNLSAPQKELIGNFKLLPKGFFYD